MVVAVDAVSSAVTVSASGTSATHTNLTIGAGLTNSALLIGVAWDANATSVSAHWDSAGTNQVMTSLGTLLDGSGVTRTTFFGLRNPTSGNKTFNLTWTTASRAAIFGISFTGVDQTSDASAFPNFVSNTVPNNATNGTPSVVVTSAIGDITVGVINSPFEIVSSIDNTQLYISNLNPPNSAMNRGVGASTVTMSGVIGQTDLWGMIGIDVAAAVAAPIAVLGAQIWI